MQKTYLLEYFALLEGLFLVKSLNSIETVMFYFDLFEVIDYEFDLTQHFRLFSSK